MTRFWALLLLVLASPALAEEAKPPAAHGSFSVTPVEACFDKLKPGEASEVKRDFASPWLECQKRLKEREAEEAKKDVEKKDVKKKEADTKEGKP
jgi:hypothetical protein